MYIVIQGSPVDGFVFHGAPPFTDPGEAADWAASSIPDEDWWVAPLQDVE